MASSFPPSPAESPSPSLWANRFETASRWALFLCALTAPHSIAASQTSFVLAVFCWLTQCAISRRWGLIPTPADWPLLLFFGLCLLSSAFSYEPRLSLKGMKSVALLGAIYLVSSRVQNLRWVVILALTLLLSCQANTIFTLGQRAAGVGVRVTNFSKRSPLLRAGLQPGDVILKADGQPIRSLETLSQLADAGTPDTSIKLQFRRGEQLLDSQIRRGAITKTSEKKLAKLRIKGADAKRLPQGVERLGAEGSLARDFRASGFYNHYATYAEVLQLLASLGIGLWLSLWKQPQLQREPNGLWIFRRLSPKQFQVLISVVLFLTLGALFCTNTRASLASLGLSIGVMLIALWKTGKIQSRTAAALLGLALIVSCAGVALAYKQRSIALTDTSEGSLYWRLVVWQEGVHLVEQHPVLGIGKDSDKIHGREWGLWGKGQLPPGHFHNSYLQIAVWWGLPALLAYGWMVWLFWLALWKSVTDARFTSQPSLEHTCSYGVLLGVCGGFTGFAASSVVHFNLGDGEVTLILWFVLGLAVAARRLLASSPHTLTKI
ncbi:MAG TPA: O-antigen ligase family protein [Acidobacteriota bacterium]|nr:O-antigen ligase family protein [Acidobacteriota bacterium]HNH81581.1 O-antigen ligase family protein [Acidobacteriota bacterium]